MWFIVIIMILSIPILGILTRSDVGQSIADAIRHNSGANEGAAARREIEQLRSDLDQLRTELDDVHAQLAESLERLEFAERILIKPADVAHDRVSHD